MYYYIYLQHMGLEPCGPKPQGGHGSCRHLVRKRGCVTPRQQKDVSMRVLGFLDNISLIGGLEHLLFFHILGTILSFD